MDISYFLMAILGGPIIAIIFVILIACLLFTIVGAFSFLFLPFEEDIKQNYKGLKEIFKDK